MRLFVDKGSSCSSLRRIVIPCGAALIVVTALVASPARDAVAQPIPQVPETVETPGPSSGIMFAAAAETAGYKSQSDVLTQLQPMLTVVAALLYVGAAMHALYTISQGGKYEAAVWYFIGPSLFFFVCNSRTMSAGAEWQFGTYKGDPSAVQQALDQVDSGMSEVSWLFDRYNRLISDAFQQLIALITNQDMRAYMIFMSRAQIMDAMFSADIEDPGLLGFSFYNLQACGRQLEAARRVALGNRDPEYRNHSEFKSAEALYNQTFGLRNVSIPPGIARNYVVELLSAWSGQETSSPPSGTEGMRVYAQCLADTQTRLSGHGVAQDQMGAVERMLDEGVSCEEMWCWMGLGIQQYALQVAQQAEREHIPEGARPEDITYVWKQIATKLQTPSGYTDAYGRTVLAVEPDISTIPVMFSGYLVRKLMTQDVRSEFLSQFAQHSGISLQPFNYNPANLTPEQSRQIVERQNQHTLAEAKRYEIYHWLMTIPYFQGAILYILATTFPFFALMIVIPGKTRAFFQWMTLWAWAKSWDVGFAVVMVIDELLWSIMPHSSYFNELTDPNHSPITAFEAAFQGDPAYSLASYYVIVGSLITSVPVVMGHAILGSKKALAGTITGGLSGVSSAVGKWVGDYTSLGQLAAGEWIRVNNAVKYGLERVNKNTGGYTSKIENLAREMDRHGQWWKTAGSWLLAAGVGTGVAAGALLVGVLTSAVSVPAMAIAGLGAVAAGSFVSGIGAREAGFGMTRRATDLEKARSELNFRFHFFDYGDTAEFRNLDAIRAGNSRRGEYWNIPDNPVNAYRDSDFVYQSARGEWEHLRGSAWGTIPAGILSAWSRWR